MSQRINDLRKNIQDAEEEIVLLRNNIKQGKDSLGSKFDDFVFCSVGANSEAWEPFYNLDKQMKDSAGKELLIVSSKEKELDFGRKMNYGEAIISPRDESTERGRIVLSHDNDNFAPRPKFYETNYDMNYGILSGEHLDFDLGAGEIIFPNRGQYLQFSANSFYSIKLKSKQINTMNGKIRKNLQVLPHLSPCFDLGLFCSLSESQDSKILTGDSVREYFEGLSGGANVYSEMKKML